MTENIISDPYAESPSEEKTTTQRHLVTPFSMVVIAAVLLLVGVVIWGVYQSQQKTVKDGPAPQFELLLYASENIPYTNPALKMDYSGDSINLADFKGDKVVVLNFWQSNCVPCHQEAAMLVQLYEDYKAQGVVLIGINAKDPDKLAYEYMAQYNITYPNGLDRGDKIQEMYRTTGYPETFIIGRDGRILKHFAGPPSENQLRTEIDRALQES